MSDDAVAPVVAAMLILAIGVTFFAAWNAYYVPSMKAQSEISHLKDVESAFLKISSDIEMAASLKREMRLSEPVPLGGGDFTFDPVRSGGMLSVRNETVDYLFIEIQNGTPSMTSRAYLRLSGYSFRPVNNFWQDQGYTWSYGVVNVTKGPVTTPLQYPDMETVSYRVAGDLFDADTSPLCTRLNVYATNISPETGHTGTSGNGNAMLTLNSSVLSLAFPNATGLNITVNSSVPRKFRDTLYDAIDQRLTNLPCSNVNVTYRAETVGGARKIGVEFRDSPNMVIFRRITTISLGAY